MSAARMGKQCQTYGEFASGGIAALANICITFPINKLIFRQQLSGSIVRFAVAELRSEGLRNAYRGLLPPLLQKGASLSIMFGSYDIFLRRFIELYPPSDTQNPVGFRLSASQTTQEQTKADSERRVGSSSKLGTPAPLMHQLAAGVLAGSVETLLMPFERVQTLMQDKAYHTTLRNTAHAFIELRKYGFREYFRGFTAVLIRNGPSTAFFFATRERVAGQFSSWKPLADKPVAIDFLSGALCGALTGSIFFPVNVAKSIMQARLGGPFESMFTTLKAVLTERDNSFQKLYRGLSLTLMRTVLSWGIINMTYEQCKHYLSSCPRRNDTLQQTRFVRDDAESN